MWFINTKKHGAAVVITVLLVLAFAWTTALAKTLYVRRSTVDIKKGRAAFYPTVYSAKKGEALTVLSELEGWYQVKTPGGPGWVFGQALSPKKPPRFTLRTLVGTTDSSELDKTAGFKGFDRATEEEYVSRNKLSAQLEMVKALEQPPFTMSDLNKFQEQGRVGPYRGER